MRALVFNQALSYRADHPEPQCGTDECLLRVHLAGICSTDLHIARGYMQFSGILGHEFVGTVLSGPPAWVGKRVVAEINCVCRRCDMCHAGLSNHCRHRTVLGISGRDGCFADCVALPVHNLHEVPGNVSDEEAVFIEPLAAACQVIKQVPIDARMHVAVVGSGRLGLLVAQVLRTCGCRLEVVGRNPHTLALCERRHIQAVTLEEVVARQDHDVVVECSGDPQGLSLALELVRPRGTIVLKSTCAESTAVNLAPAVVNEVTIVGSRCGPFPQALACLARKEVDVLGLISRSFRLERGVEALAAAADPGNVKILLKVNPR